MEQADLIWMNGEFVAWEDAKVHVLTHGLHYGTGVFEGVRCYDTEIGPAVFRHADHLDRLQVGRALLHADSLQREELRQATLELIGRNGLSACYIRPIAFRGYGTMGLFPLDAPVDVAIAGGTGARTWARRAARRHPGQDLLAGGGSPDSLIPHAKARASTSTRAGQDRVATRPATRRRSCSTTTATSARARARTSSSSATARSSRRRRPRRSSTASTASRRSRSRGTSARGRRAQHRPRRALAGRRGLPDRHRRRAVPVREIDDHAIGDRQARPDHPRGAEAPSRTPSTAGPSAPRLARPGAGRRAGAEPTASQRERVPARSVPTARPCPTSSSTTPPARRHAGRGHVAVRRREGARRPQARRAGHRPDRGRLPVLEPQGAGALRAAGQRDVRARRRSPPSE